MRRQIDHEHKKEEHRSEVQRGGPPNAVEKGIGINEVDIRLRCGCQACQHHDRKRDEALSKPTPAVIPEPMQNPKKQKGHDDVK